MERTILKECSTPASQSEKRAGCRLLLTFWQVDDLPGVLDAFEAAINADELGPQLTGSPPAGYSPPLDRLSQR